MNDIKQQNFMNLNSCQLIICVPLDPCLATEEEQITPTQFMTTLARSKSYQTTLHNDCQLTINYISQLELVVVTCYHPVTQMRVNYAIKSSKLSPRIAAWLRHEEALFEMLVEAAQLKCAHIQQGSFLVFDFARTLASTQLCISNAKGQRARFIQLDGRYAVAPASLFYDKNLATALPCCVAGVPIEKYKYPASYEDHESSDFDICVFLLPQILPQQRDCQRIFVDFDESQSIGISKAKLVRYSIGRLSLSEADLKFSRLPLYNQAIQECLGSAIEVTLQNRTDTYQAAIGIYLGKGYFFSFTWQHMQSLCNCMSQLQFTAKLATCQLFAKNQRYFDCFCKGFGEGQERESWDLQALQHSIRQQNETYRKAKRYQNFNAFRHWRSLVMYQTAHSIHSVSQIMQNIQKLSAQIQHQKQQDNHQVLNYLCYIRAVLCSFQLSQLQGPQQTWSLQSFKSLSREKKEIAFCLLTLITLCRQLITFDLAEILSNQRFNDTRMPQVILADVYFRYSVQVSKSALQKQLSQYQIEKMLREAFQIYAKLSKQGYSSKASYFSALLQYGLLSTIQGKAQKLELAQMLADKLFVGRQLAYYKTIINIQIGLEQCHKYRNYKKQLQGLKKAIELIRNSQLVSQFLYRMLKELSNKFIQLCKADTQNKIDCLKALSQILEDQSNEQVITLSSLRVEMIELISNAKRLKMASSMSFIQETINFILKGALKKN